MKKIYNFSTCPAPVAPEVREKLNEAFQNYNKTGFSITDISRSSPEYDKLVKLTEKNLRKLLDVPNNYKILFMNGGESVHYSAIPLNLLSDHKCADYIISGLESKRATTEAKKFGDIAIAATSGGASPIFSTVPSVKRSDIRPDADYVYMRYANMVNGSKYNYIPDTGNIPLVADMSAVFLSEPISISKFALVFASCSTNVSVPGISVAILRDDIFRNDVRDLPHSLSYKARLTEPTYDDMPSAWNIHLVNLVVEWIIAEGGLEEMKRRNEKKASILYDYLDRQEYYTVPVDRKCRSMLHVCFITGDDELDKKFIREAKREGLVNLAGDSTHGGMRASLYNTMPTEGVQKLVEFMKAFAMANIKLSN